MLKFVSRFHDRLAQAVRWKTKVTPCVRKLLDKSVEKSRNMRMISRSSNEYQVFEGQTRFCIVLKEKKWSFACITRELRWKIYAMYITL